MRPTLRQVLLRAWLTRVDSTLWIELLTGKFTHHSVLRWLCGDWRLCIGAPDRSGPGIVVAIVSIVQCLLVAPIILSVTLMT